MTSDKPEWFELSNDDATSSPVAKDKRGKKLPIIAAAAVGAIVIGGAFFANANDEPNANASTSSMTIPGTPSTSASTGAPTISNLPQGTAGQGGRDGFGHDGDHRDGFHPDGDHHDH